MGFDVYGKEPWTKHGEYFRNNVWWWPPLWSYTCELCDDVLDKEDQEHGFSNSGHYYDKELAREVGYRLLESVNSGFAKEWKDNYEKWQRALPREKCDICGGTGERHDDVVDGKCNACGGAGDKEAWATHYPFDVDNIKAFAHFCIESGGFTIC